MSQTRAVSLGALLGLSGVSLMLAGLAVSDHSYWLVAYIYGGVTLIGWLGYFGTRA